MKFCLRLKILDPSLLDCAVCHNEIQYLDSVVWAIELQSKWQGSEVLCGEMQWSVLQFGADRFYRVWLNVV